MVTIKLDPIDARRLRRILASDKKEYREGIAHLEKIKETDPDRKLGTRKQTPEEAIETTKDAIELIDRVLKQIREN